MYAEKFDLLFRVAPEYVESIIEATKDLVAYSNYVIEEQILLQARNEGCDISSYRLEKMNKDRVSIHDKACEACNLINRIAQEKGMRKIFDFELESYNNPTRSFQRYSPTNHAQVAHFVATFINEYYNRGLLELGKYDQSLDDVTFHKVDQVKDFEGVTEYDIPDVGYDEKEMRFIQSTTRKLIEHNDRSDIRKFLKESPEKLEIHLANGVKMILSADERIKRDIQWKSVIEGKAEIPDSYNVILESSKPFKDTSNVLVKGIDAGFEINRTNPKQCIGIDIPITQIQDIINHNNGIMRSELIQMEKALEEQEH